MILGHWKCYTIAIFAILAPSEHFYYAEKLAQKYFTHILVYTANISAVKITVFRRVPFPAVIPLYYLHLITALSTVEKCKHRFTVVYYKIYTFTW